MKNQVALVTGGTGDIGTAICRRLFKDGARVIATYNINSEFGLIELWQEEQKKLGYDIAIYGVDVADFLSCKELIENVLKEHYSIDILVNNAGITHDIQLCKMELCQWDSVIQTNLSSVFNVTRHVLAGMIERGYGRIINISSINGQKGQFGQTNYSAAKAGIHGFTKALACEVARKGITVNTVSPGYIDTSMTASIPDEICRKIVTQIPIGRFGSPIEIAHGVAFLACSESGFITGMNLMINGGQYLL